MLYLLAALPAFAGDLTIDVADPSVVEVQLACGSRVLKSPVVAGVATFSENVGDCAVSFLSQVGSVSGNDKYTCGSTGCTKNAIEHRQVGNAPDRVTIVLTDASTKLLELNCPSGYRVRAPVETNTAVFDGVPAGEDCNLFWKNSAPAKGRKLRPGTWYCQNVGGTGVCRRK
jgi:hypothetical protein